MPAGALRKNACHLCLTTGDGEKAAFFLLRKLSLWPAVWTHTPYPSPCLHHPTYLHTFTPAASATLCGHHTAAVTILLRRGLTYEGRRLRGIFLAAGTSTGRRIPVHGLLPSPLLGNCWDAFTPVLGVLRSRQLVRRCCMLDGLACSQDETGRTFRAEERLGMWLLAPAARHICETPVLHKQAPYALRAASCLLLLPRLPRLRWRVLGGSNAPFASILRHLCRRARTSMASAVSASGVSYLCGVFAAQNALRCILLYAWFTGLPRLRWRWVRAGRTACPL